jgi:hypothetical protein
LKRLIKLIYNRSKAVGFRFFGATFLVAAVTGILSILIRLEVYPGVVNISDFALFLANALFVAAGFFVLIRFVVPWGLKDQVELIDRIKARHETTKK